MSVRVKGCLAGSVGRAWDSWSSGCRFEPILGVETTWKNKTLLKKKNESEIKTSSDRRKKKTSSLADQHKKKSKGYVLHTRQMIPDGR